MVAHKDQKQSEQVDDVPDRSLMRLACSQLKFDKSEENYSTAGCGADGEGATTTVREVCGKVRGWWIVID